ncbi:MAG: HAMP domain-containing histidine kinase, partial [Silvibacterium sp.]|nr:HAMP domain-containing histidine kinase [Silvibacterium sp.]
LGMWVSAQIIDRMRGSIAVWSSRTSGRSGTGFSVFLPFDTSPSGVYTLRGEQEQLAEDVVAVISSENG